MSRVMKALENLAARQALTPGAFDWLELRDACREELAAHQEPAAPPPAGAERAVAVDKCGASPAAHPNIVCVKPKGHDGNHESESGNVWAQVIA